MSQKIAVCLTAAMAFAGFSRGQEAAPEAEAPKSYTVEELVSLVERNNPGLKMYQARARAMDKKPSQAGALPDPMLSLALRGGAMYTQTQAGVEAAQEIPFPGKRPLMAEAASLEARAAWVEYQTQRLALEEEARRLCFDIIYFDRAEAILEESRQYLLRMRDSVRVHYSAGRGPQYEVFRVETALSEIDEQVLMLRRRREAAGALLACCLGLAPGEELWKHLIPPTELSTLRPLGDIEKLAEKHSPAVEKARLMRERSGAMLKLARKELRPDFVLRGEYWPSQGGEGDEWMVYAGVKVPLYARRKQLQGVAEARENLVAGELGIADAQQNVTYDIREAHAMALRALETYSLYRDALEPQNAAVLSATEISYGTGQTDFDSYVQAVLAHLKARMRLAEEFSEHEKQVARLRMLAGTDVTVAAEAEYHE